MDDHVRRYVIQYNCPGCLIHTVSSPAWDTESITENSRCLGISLMLGETIVSGKKSAREIPKMLSEIIMFGRTSTRGIQ